MTWITTIERKNGFNYLNTFGWFVSDLVGRIASRPLEESSEREVGRKKRERYRLSGCSKKLVQPGKHVTSPLATLNASPPNPRLDMSPAMCNSSLIASDAIVFIKGYIQKLQKFAPTKQY